MPSFSLVILANSSYATEEFSSTTVQHISFDVKQKEVKWDKVSILFRTFTEGHSYFKYLIGLVKYWALHRTEMRHLLHREAQASWGPSYEEQIKFAQD